MRVFAVIIPLILVAFLFVRPAQAETVGNDFGCEACLAGVMYEGIEAVSLIETHIRHRLGKLEQGFVVSEEFEDDGFKLLVEGNTINLSIDSLEDESYIQILPDAANAGTAEWSPRVIILPSDEKYHPNPSTPLDQVWMAVRDSRIHEWIMQSESADGKFRKGLRQRITQGLSLVLPK